jgi:hypothetical protein
MFFIILKFSLEFVMPELLSTYMLVDEDGILDLRVYSDYPVSIKRNQDILLKSNNLILPCDPIQENYKRSALRYRVDGCNLLKIHISDTIKLREKAKYHCIVGP